MQAADAGLEALTGPDVEHRLGFARIGQAAHPQTPVGANLAVIEALASRVIGRRRQPGERTVDETEQPVPPGHQQAAVGMGGHAAGLGVLGPAVGPALAGMPAQDLPTRDVYAIKTGLQRMPQRGLAEQAGVLAEGRMSVMG